jgi:hypothetical protein
MEFYLVKFVHTIFSYGDINPLKIKLFWTTVVKK